MSRALFYHLTQSPLESLVPSLLRRALSADMRVVVRGTDPRRLDWLDERLWLGGEDDFLPHGRAGGPHDADQPVLLTERPDMPTAPACLMAIDGATVRPDETAGLDRVWIIFDGHDAAAVAGARAHWRALQGAGLTLEYWSEASGRWTKEREAGPGAG